MKTVKQLAKHMPPNIQRWNLAKDMWARGYNAKRNSAEALVKRGFLEFVKNAAWGSVYRITAQGRIYANSLPAHLKDNLV